VGIGGICLSCRCKTGTDYFASSIAADDARDINSIGKRSGGGKKRDAKSRRAKSGRKTHPYFAAKSVYFIAIYSQVSIRAVCRAESLFRLIKSHDRWQLAATGVPRVLKIFSARGHKCAVAFERVKRCTANIFSVRRGALLFDNSPNTSYVKSSENQQRFIQVHKSRRANCQIVHHAQRNVFHSREINGESKIDAKARQRREKRRRKRLAPFVSRRIRHEEERLKGTRGAARLVMTECI